MAADASSAPATLDVPTERPGPVRPAWHVLWTHSQCEQLVCDQLARQGFRLFLPRVEVWARRGGVRRLVHAPLFPGYVFLHHAMDKRSYLKAIAARGLVRILGERWDRLAVVGDGEVEAIQKVVAAGVPAMPHPYLREGRRVRISRGPLTDAEGILLRVKASKGLLVLSIDLLQRSVAVEVDCTLVVPA